MKQATKRFMSMILSLLLVVGSFIVFFQLIRPAYEEAQSKRSEVIGREEVIETQQDAIEEVKRLIEGYKSDPAVQESVSAALPTREEVGTALYQLNGIAAGRGLTLQSFSVAAPQLEVSRATSSAPSALRRPLGSITFQMKFAASYEDIKAFLDTIQTNIRIFDVTNLTIQPGVRPGADLFSVDASIVAYYQVNE